MSYQSKTKGLVVGITIAVCVLALIVTGCTSQWKTELTLTDYPELFKEDTTIIIGQSASHIERESATAIAAKLRELSGNEPVINNDTDVSQDEKADHNLILIGMPNSNSVLSEVYEITDATRVTSEYPGEDKGILEIMPNPLNSEKVLLIVAGSDEQGMKAVSIMVTNHDKIAELEGKTMVVSLQDASRTQKRTITVPSGYLEVSVSPAEVYASIGEQIKIRCTIGSLVNTPVDINSIDVVVFDSRNSLIRKQPMTLESHWSASIVYTVVGDEAYYRLLVDFTTPLAPPGDYSEYTVDSFPIVIKQKGGK